MWNMQRRGFLVYPIHQTKSRRNCTVLTANYSRKNKLITQIHFNFASDIVLEYVRQIVRVTYRSRDD